MLEFMREAWKMGDPKDAVGDLLQSFKMVMPDAQVPLQQAWKLYRKWSSKELPDQAPPCHLEEALAYSGLAFREGHGRCGAVLLGAFDGFLRTGEFLKVKPEDVVFGSDSMVVDLGETKGVKRRGGSDAAHRPLLN